MREIISLEIITILLTSCVAILTLVKVMFAIRFDDFISVSNVTRYLKIYSKDVKTGSLFHLFLSINTLIGASIFSYFGYDKYIEEVAVSWQWILTCAFIILVIFVLKFVVENIIASLFNIQQVIETYQFTKITYRNYVGIILVVGSILLAYVFPNSTYIIAAIVSISVLVSFIGYYVAYKSNEKLLSANLFYFILYLCALEIGPYIIAYYWYRTLG